MLQGVTLCPPLPPTVYAGGAEHVTWEGYALAREVLDYLRSGVLRDRVADLTLRDQIEADIREAAADDVADDLVRELLASEPSPEPWQIGEAIAEVLLGEWHSALWVWNQGRDRRTPRASLPGADLVGFRVRDGESRFLFGEVKSSEDVSSPPNVLYGRHGMVNQLETLAERRDILWTLIRWLRARCLEQGALDAYRGALKALARSSGKDLILVGCLLRDTDPNLNDVAGRGGALSKSIAPETRVELRVWHLPDKLTRWHEYLGPDSDA